MCLLLGPGVLLLRIYLRERSGYPSPKMHVKRTLIIILFIIAIIAYNLDVRWQGNYEIICVISIL